MNAVGNVLDEMSKRISAAIVETFLYDDVAHGYRLKLAAIKDRKRVNFLTRNVSEKWGDLTIT